MQSVKWNVKILFMFSVIAPGMAMSAAEKPFQSPDLSVSSKLRPATPLNPSASAGTPALSKPTTVTAMGAAIATDKLETYRGGTEVSNTSVSKGMVQDTTAINVSSGSNSISEGAFAHASGLPMVIQNSGSNVLIQNSTIVNVQFK